MKIYDLRSDTITKPSDAMRKAMYDAECGDDVYSEDKTVLKLQDEAKKITGKEAALFVTSGTMGNLIPTIVLGGKGKEIILEKECHLIHYELGGVSSIGDLMPTSIEAKRGILTKDLVEKVVTSRGQFDAEIAAVEIENTHNRAGGTVYPIEVLKELYSFLNKKSIHVHMDGARVFNASIASKVSVKDISANTHSITFCLSKGLGCPIGSLLCGDKDFIAKSLRLRKLIGGGLRQVGIVAAAGLYALKHNIKSLEVDHAHAKLIASAISKSEIGVIDVKDVETNIVIAETFQNADKVAEQLAKKGVRASVFGKNRLRFVTHRDINSNEIKEVCSILSSFNTKKVK